MLDWLFELLVKAAQKLFNKSEALEMNIVDHREFFQTKEDYLNFRKKFKEKATKKAIENPADYLLLNILRGHEMDRGFTEITNKNKRLNGMSPYKALKQAYYSLLAGPSEDLELPDFTKDKVKNLLLDRQVAEYAIRL